MNRLTLIALSLALAAPTLRADELPLFQVGLHGGYRTGGSLEDADTGADRDFEDSETIALALELRFAQGDDRFYQLWYSRQDSEVDDGIETHGADIEYLHIGGTLPLGPALARRASRRLQPAPTTGRVSPARLLSASRSRSRNTPPSASRRVVT